MGKSQCNMIYDASGKLIGRVCSKCTASLPTDSFYRDHRSAAGGFQRTCKSCQRKYRNGRHTKMTHKEKLDALRKWRSKNREKARAHSMVGHALHDGRLVRETCHCGLKAEAHHDDYTKPLDVRWLCRVHHSEHHRKYKEEEIPYIDWSIYGSPGKKRKRSGNPDDIKHPRYKITVAVADEIRAKYAAGAKQAEIMREMKLSRTIVFNVVHNVHYKATNATAATDFNPEDFES